MEQQLGRGAGPVPQWLSSDPQGWKFPEDWDPGLLLHGARVAAGGWNFSGMCSVWAQGLKQVCKDPHQGSLPHALCPLRADEDRGSSLLGTLT